ncbi:MAG: MoaD/ThiS family protein [Chloroflexi bacterium]|nr:MoaD/ThiS family protein [Chloroflexota bacterium]
MKLTVKFFATLKAMAQTDQLVIELKDNLPAVKNWLAEISIQKPELESPSKSVLVAVNGEFSFSEQVITANDQIALFPPVSGG